MFLHQILDRHCPSLSFEFFPPRTDDAKAAFYREARQLADLRPTFVSVTYGAGGTTQAGTSEAVSRLDRELGLETAHHLTCLGNSAAQLTEILAGLKTQGVQNIMALRGDAPRGRATFQAHPQGFRHAAELVALIRSFDCFSVGVAGYPEGHPETLHRMRDLDYLKAKVDAGADCIVTQLFFENRDFYDFRDRCVRMGISVPIVAGIMPVIFRRGVLRMSELCGAMLPARLVRGLMGAAEDAEVVRLGIDWAVEQCADLIANDVRGIHFYTLNHAPATAAVLAALGYPRATAEAT